jgi:TrmH family RNA methyltransferase
VGALLRSARAFGFNTVFSINSADIWSQKVIRAAAGTQFSMQIYEVNFAEFKQLYEKHLSKSKLLIADAQVGGGAGVSHPTQKEYGLVLGNEGSGVTAEVRALPHEIISIPMCAGVESLNVAVAGGILLYTLKNI